MTLTLPGASLSSTTAGPVEASTADYARGGPHVIPLPSTLSPRWRLAAKGFSLNVIRDHTFQMKEGNTLLKLK